MPNDQDRRFAGDPSQGPRLPCLRLIPPCWRTPTPEGRARPQGELIHQIRRGDMDRPTTTGSGRAAAVSLRRRTVVVLGRNPPSPLHAGVETLHTTHSIHRPQTFEIWADPWTACHCWVPPQQPADPWDCWIGHYLSPPNDPFMATAW